MAARSQGGYISPEQAREALAGVNPEVIAAIFKNAIKVRSTDNEVTLAVVGDGQGEGHILFRAIRQGDGLIRIDRSASKSSATQIELPDPAKRGATRPENINLGVKTELERMVQDLVVVYALRENDYAVNNRNVDAVLDAIKETAWIKNLPRPAAAQMRAGKQIVDLENAVRELVDPETYEQSRGTRGKVVLDHYNRAVVGGQALRDLHTTNPGIAAWIRGRVGAPATYHHPDEAISSVRAELEQMGLRSSNWEAIARLSPATIGRIRKGARAKTPPQHIAALFNAIAQYQIDEPTSNQIEATRELLARVDDQREVPMQHLTNLAGLTLRADVPGDSRSLGRIANYLRGQRRTDPGVATWDELLRASDAWHQERAGKQIRQISDLSDGGNQHILLHGTTSKFGLTDLGRDRGRDQVFMSPKIEIAAQYAQGAIPRRQQQSWDRVPESSRIIASVVDTEGFTHQSDPNAPRRNPGIYTDAPHRGVNSPGVNVVRVDDLSRMAPVGEAHPRAILLDADVRKYLGPIRERAAEELAEDCPEELTNLYEAYRREDGESRAESDLEECAEEIGAKWQEAQPGRQGIEELQKILARTPQDERIVNEYRERILGQDWGGSPMMESAGIRPTVAASVGTGYIAPRSRLLSAASRSGEDRSKRDNSGRGQIRY